MISETGLHNYCPTIQHSPVTYYDQLVSSSSRLAVLHIGYLQDSHALLLSFPRYLRLLECHPGPKTDRPKPSHWCLASLGNGIAKVSRAKWNVVMIICLRVNNVILNKSQNLKPHNHLIISAISVS